MQVLNALAPCQQEQGDLSGAEAMLRSSVILAKHQQDLTSQVTRLPAPIPRPCARPSTGEKFHCCHARGMF